MLAKRRLWSQAFLAETVETGDKSRDLTDNIFKAPCMFCEESLGNINAKDIELFRNGSVREFYRLKALIALEQVNTSVVEKINFDGEANWSGVVNFHCMKMSLVMNRR